MDLIKKCLVITAPVFFGYISIGIPFGIMMVNAGYPWWLPPLMCLVMYAGAGQYFMVGLLAGGAGLFEILLAQFLVSIRQIFYGLSLIKRYKGTGKYKPYLMFAVTDETFALVSSIDVPKNVNRGLFYTIISALDHFYWTLGTFIGSAGYKILETFNITEYFKGVDFALTALFMVLVIGQYKASHDLVPVLTGLIVSAVTVFLYRAGLFASSNIIWVAIFFGTGAMLMMRGRKFFSEYRKTLEQEEKNNTEEES
ncbi:MAG: AzlC family ABC transporter permease [Treponema sp.]|nr:AzlC family ABC transporter permease [Treponema sp.]